MKKSFLKLSIVFLLILAGCKEYTDKEILTDALNKLNKCGIHQLSERIKEQGD